MSGRVLTVAIAGAAVDAGLVVADVTIRSGRARADDGLNPASATLELTTATPGGAAFAIGDALEVDVDGAPRFSGRVGEIARASGAARGETLFTVVAVGNISRFDRILVAMPLPAQTAAARALAVLTGAGFRAVVQGGDADNLAAYGQVGDSPATLTTVLQGLITDTAAVIADDPDGAVRVQFPDGRLSEDRWIPDPAETHVDVAWEQTDDLVNDCTVAYAGGEASAQDAASIARFDPHSLRLSTNLADAATADRRVASIVARLARPVWACGTVETWDPAVLEHNIGAVVTLAPLPVSAPVVGSWQGVLEGWTDTYTPAGDGSGLIVGIWDLAIGDVAHSTETVVWAGVDPALAWDEVDPATAWDEALTNADLEGQAA